MCCQFLSYPVRASATAVVAAAVIEVHRSPQQCRAETVSTSSTPLLLLSNTHTHTHTHTHTPLRTLCYNGIISAIVCNVLQWKLTRCRSSSCCVKIVLEVFGNDSYCSHSRVIIPMLIPTHSQSNTSFVFLFSRHLYYHSPLPFLLPWPQLYWEYM